jgi:hypothetical protein
LKHLLIFLPLAMAALPAQAETFNVTIERASSVSAAPTSSVNRGGLAPPEGVSASPERERAVYSPEIRQRAGTLPKNIPVPTSNPAAVSFCLSDVL